MTLRLAALLTALFFAGGLACGESERGERGLTDSGVIGGDRDLGTVGGGLPDSRISVGDGAGLGGGEDAISVAGPDTTEARAIETAEMVVKIVSPSAHPHVTVTSRTGILSGIVTGVPDRITWETSAGESGEAAGVPFWKTGGIPLRDGDNIITVRAAREVDGVVEVQSDKITMTVNQAFKFGDRLTARPDFIFVNQDVAVIFTIRADLYRNFVPESMALIEVGPDGLELPGSRTPMADDGDVENNGDEITGDGVYTASLRLFGEIAGPRYFRAQVDVRQGANATTKAFSEIFTLDVVSAITPEECNSIQALQQSAMNAYRGQVEGAGQSAAVRAAHDALANAPQAAETGITRDGYGVWVRYKNGLLGALPLSPEGLRGAPAALGTTHAPAANVVRVGSRSALLLSPYAESLGPDDENHALSQLFDDVQCPSYRVEGPVENVAAGLNAFQDMHRYGAVSVVSHGDTYFDTLSEAAKERYGWFHKGAQELIWTGEPVNCAAFGRRVGGICVRDDQCGSGARCVIQSLVNGVPQGICVDYTQADLRRGRIVFGPERYGILPSFVIFHARASYPDSVVYLGSCRSAWNGSMAAAFFGMGARAIAGWSNYVSSDFAAETAARFVDRMVRPDPETGVGKQSGQAHVEIPDPKNPDAFFRLIGARNLDASQAGLLNASFETGNAAGWERSGDGRVISRLGATQPVQGKFTGILSTGLGFTTTVGVLQQTFCVSPGATELSFWWRFHSEEFLEWCNTAYQDTFEATLCAGTAEECDPKNAERPSEVAIESVTVDDLCPAGPPTGVGINQFNGCPQGVCRALHPIEISDVHFDQGGAWKMSDWVQARVDLAATGFSTDGPVTLRLEATDKGDSIFDSVILVDGVAVE